MGKLFKRIFSYALDVILVSLIASLVSCITIFNPNYKEMEEISNKYQASEKIYTKCSKLITDSFADSLYTIKESEKIVKKYGEYFKDLTVIEEDKKVADKDEEEIMDILNKERIKYTNKFGYKYNKLSIYKTIISTVMIILYFGVLQYFMNGQTVFKKIFRLKVVDAKDENKKVSLIKYVIRAILISEIILTIVDSALICFLSKNMYIAANYWVSQAKTIYEMIFLVVLIIRNDQRSVHDILLNTKVNMYDANGNVINQELFGPVDDVQEVKEVKEVKEIKKTTTKKQTKKTKEVVKAEKIDD